MRVTIHRRINDPGVDSHKVRAALEAIGIKVDRVDVLPMDSRLSVIADSI